MIDTEDNKGESPNHDQNPWEENENNRNEQILKDVIQENGL